MIEFIDDAAENDNPVIVPKSCPSTLDIDVQFTWNVWFVPNFDLFRNHSLMVA